MSKAENIFGKLGVIKEPTYTWVNAVNVGTAKSYRFKNGMFNIGNGVTSNCRGHVIDGVLTTDYKENNYFHVAYDTATNTLTIKSDYTSSPSLYCTAFLFYENLEE